MKFQNLHKPYLISDGKYSNVGKYILPKTLSDNYRFILIIVAEHNISSGKIILGQSMIIPTFLKTREWVFFGNDPSIEIMRFTFVDNNSLEIKAHTIDGNSQTDIHWIYQF